MGIGDKKPPLRHNGATIRDDVIGKQFYYGMVRSCPEPHVIRRFGIGGKANVSVYTCRKCRYHEDTKWFGGVKCIYEQQQPK